MFSLITSKRFYKYLCCFFLLINGMYANALDGALKGRYELKDNVEKKRLVVQGEGTLASKTNDYVSIAQLSEKYYIISNHRRLLLLNREDAKICVLKPNLDKLSKDNKIYMPTGVFIDHDANLYLANYKGNNILKGRVNTKACQVEFIQAYSSIHTKGPENVTVNSARHILVSANYDAGTVTAFDLQKGKELWSSDVGQAHGVTVAGDKVYVTGLIERKIYELNLSDGKILRAKGGVGWEPMKSQFLWPTSIFSLDNDTLIVSDPQSGFISFVDKKTLETMRYMGGNGPSYRWFNYPYAALPIQNEIVVLSSKRSNILFLDKFGMEVKDNLILFDDKWAKDANQAPYFGLGWEGFINEKGPRLKLGDKIYKLGFGHLHPLQKGPVLRVPDTDTLYNLPNYFYFLQGYGDATGLNFFFSSSARTLFGIINESMEPDLLIATNSLRLDSWFLNNNIIDVDGSVLSQLSINQLFREQANKIYSVLNRDGWISPEAFYDVGGFSSELFLKDERLTPSQVNKYLNKVFSSSIGREFKYSYDQCTKDYCDIQQLQEAARAYYFEAEGYAYLNLDEYILVGMLSGQKMRQQAEQTISYDDCGLGKYYNGYGPDALINPNDNHYLSAHDLNTSYVCFNSKKEDEKVLKNIRLGWYSKEELPKKVAIYGINKKNGTQHETLIKTVQLKQVNELNGYLFSSIKVDSNQSFDQFMIKLLEGGKQGRLILRSLTPMFKEVSVSKDTTNKIKAKVVYDNCGCGQYYDGYGLDELRRKSLETYLSSHNIDTSCVGFNQNTETRTLLKKIDFVWYSREEVPQSLAVYGIEKKGGKEHDVLIKTINPKQSTHLVEINDYVVSELSLNLDKLYDRYKIKLLKGGQQDRLLLRALNPVFESDLDISSDKPTELLQLADNISHQKAYGMGIQKVASHAACTPKAIIDYMKSKPALHCGNFAYLFINELPNSYHAKVFNLKTFDGRIHVIVQVNKKDETVVVDPTTGMLYPCDLASLIDGSCSYESVQFLTPPHPALLVYSGKGFFYGAEIIKTYQNVEEMTQDYCSL